MASRPKQRGSSTPVPRDHVARPKASPAWFGASLDRPSVLLRVRVVARRRTLDVQLARGADPSQSAALALRARQLVTRRTRDSFAFGLEALVKEAAPAPLPVGMAIPLPRRQIMETRPTLPGLPACLRAERPAFARGMALLSWVSSAGAGPAYNPYAGSAPHDVLAAAAEALDGGWPDAG